MKAFIHGLYMPFYIRPGDAPEYQHLNQAGTAVGAKDTDDYITNEKPINISHEIFKLNPDQNRFLSYVLEAATVEPTTQHNFSHLEKARNPQWVKYTGADESVQSASTIIIANFGRLVGRMRLVVAETREVILVTATPTSSSVSISRNFGTSGTPLLKTGYTMRIMTAAREQGGTMLDYRSFGKVEVSGGTTIMSLSLDMTGTASAEPLIDSADPFMEALTDQWMNAKAQTETELVFGARNADAVLSGGSHPTHTTQGLTGLISTHKYSFNGRMTRFDFWDLMDELAKDNVQRNKPIRLALVCSWKLLSVVSAWSLTDVRVSTNVKTDGLQITEIQTPRGTFDLVPVDLLSEDPAFEGLGFIVNRDNIVFRPLIGKEDRDIRYYPVNQDEVDSKQGQILGEYGWEYYHEESFAMLEGIVF